MADDKTPPEESPQDPTGRKSGSNKAALGAAATIGSAAIAAALLYAGKRFLKKPEDSANGPKQAPSAPSGEPPETD